MGAQFHPSHENGRTLVRCCCEELELEPMSCPACQLTLDLNERNWRDLLAFLGLPVEPAGTIEAPRLAALCRLQLALCDMGVSGRAQAAIEPTETTGARGAWCVTGGRPANYLRDRCRALLKIALSAGDAWVHWA